MAVGLRDKALRFQSDSQTSKGSGSGELEPFIFYALIYPATSSDLHNREVILAREVDRFLCQLAIELQILAVVYNLQ